MVASSTNWSWDYRGYPKTLLYCLTLPSLEELEIVFEDHWIALHIIHNELVKRSQCSLKGLAVPTSKGSKFFKYAGAFSRLEELSLGWVFQQDLLSIAGTADNSLVPHLPTLKRLTIQRSQFTADDVLGLIHARKNSDAVEELLLVKLVVRGTVPLDLPRFHCFYEQDEYPELHDHWSSVLSTLLHFKDVQKMIEDTDAMHNLERLCLELENVEADSYAVDCYLSGTQPGYNTIRSVVEIGEVINQQIESKAFSKLQDRFNTAIRRIMCDPFLFRELPANWRREVPGPQKVFGHVFYEA